MQVGGGMGSLLNFLVTVPDPAAPNITNENTAVAIIFFTAFSFCSCFRRVNVSLGRSSAWNSLYRFMFGIWNKNDPFHCI
jgi:hypothetical protein